MPSEIRHLMFRPGEVAEAIGAYRRRLGQPLPRGVLKSCEAEGNGSDTPITVRLTIEHDSSAAAPTVIAVDSPTLAAALILRCRELRIPLPIKADKSLQRFGDQVCLVATYNPRQNAVPAVATPG